MSLFCLFALVNTINHNVLDETTVWEESFEALFHQELIKNIPLKLAKLISRLDHRLKYILLTS